VKGGPYQVSVPERVPRPPLARDGEFPSPRRLTEAALPRRADRRH
jgi:hypothetical protein